MAVFCEEGESFSKVKELISKHQKKVVVVTDSHVKELYGSKIQADLIAFPEGETHKTFKTIEYIHDTMCSLGLGKNTLMIALGGGVVTDVAGFAASTFCRGIPLISIPTTLMGMVDAAHGGKNGVNSPYGKNLIGTFYDPEAVIIDPIFLKSLNETQIASGFTEMLKIAAVFDRTLFWKIKEALERKTSYISCIKECINCKEAIVAIDKTDAGIRHILNFGHTIGHALEASSKYSLSHAVAVAIGMKVEGLVAERLGIFNEYSDLVEAIDLLKFPKHAFNFEKIEPYLLLDKKGPSCYVLLTSVGSALSKNGRFSHPVDDKIIKECL